MRPSTFPLDPFIAQRSCASVSSLDEELIVSERAIHPIARQSRRVSALNRQLANLSLASKVSCAHVPFEPVSRIFAFRCPQVALLKSLDVVSDALRG